MSASYVIGIISYPPTLTNVAYTFSRTTRTNLNMSGEVRPISAAQFAQAIEDLPFENLYTKAVEIQNSIAHLQRSNAQLQEYSDSIKNDTTLAESVRTEGDKDCLEAISENEIVIKRQTERIELLKQEVERRGGRWHDGGLQDESTGAATNGLENGTASESMSTSRPRLTDEELRRRLEEQMGQDEPDDGGMHL